MITGVSPSRVPMGTPTSVTISGQGLCLWTDSIGTVTVTLNTLPATVNSVSPTSIVVTSPVGSTAHDTGDVVVTSAGLGQSTRLRGGWTYDTGCCWR